MFRRILAAICFLAISVTVATAIHAVHVGKLPRSLLGTKAIYDGDDSIFLVGGHGNPKILQFNLTSLEYKDAGQLPHGITMGEAGQAESGHLYYFGGLTYAQTQENPFILWKLSPTFSNPQNISFVRDHGAYISMTKATADEWIIVGGAHNGGYPSAHISKFTVSSESLERVAALPEAVNGVATAALDGDVYIFGGNNQGFGEEPDHIKYITKFSPTSNVVEKLNLSLHLGIEQATAVTVGDSIYVVGGKRRELFRPEQHFLSIFTPSLGTVEHFVVPNFPRGLGFAGTAYVEKTNRIYTFGGRRETTTINDVYYIQL